MEPLALITGLWGFLNRRSPFFFTFILSASHFLPPVHNPPFNLLNKPPATTAATSSLFLLLGHLAALLPLYSQVGTATLGFKHGVPVSPLSIWHWPFPANRLLMKRRREWGMRRRWSTLLWVVVKGFSLLSTSFISVYSGGPEVQVQQQRGPSLFLWASPLPWPPCFDSFYISLSLSPASLESVLM